MTTVSVVYHTTYGHTRVLADHVAAGAREVPGAEVHLLEITAEQVVGGRWSDERTSAQLNASDAIILGAPTYMGSVSAVFKSFLEAAFYPWLGQEWKDKLVGGFTNSASQSGDKLLSLQQLAVFAAQMGMLWVPLGDPPGNNWSGGTRDDINRLGSWLGVMSQSNSDQGDEAAGSHGDMVTAERYGTRIAQVAARWAHGSQYTTERFGEEEFRALSARTASEARARA
jgi:multimeric flavodoxin WrbA